MKAAEDQRGAISRAIFRWYRRHGRRLPWRGIRDPYRILIAEIMLHQTRVGRVLQAFPEFLRRFPSLHALAAAPQTDVIIAWRGMGYNNRAVRIHRLARQLSIRRDGRIPRTLQECRRLPGIGKYTAHALLVSVHRMDLPVVDVNIRRFLSRLFWRMKTTADLRSEHEIWTRAESLVPRGRAYDWTQALMDIGATLCTARTPKCPACPVAALCMSRTTMKPAPPTVRRPEPSRFGIPNRLHRGRIIETLRSSRNGLTVRQIERGIPGRRSRQPAPWLRTLIATLEKDGLVRIRGDLREAGTRVLLA